MYHYVGGQGATAEADHFVDSISNWIGEGVLVIDWESNENSEWGNLGYLDAVCRRVYERTGVPPMIYASRSVFPWDTAASNNAGTWVAQYANNEPTGYQDVPWNEDAYGCAIRQYSSTGRLDGWGGNLDLNKAYMDGAAWMRYANPGNPAPAPNPIPVQPFAKDVTDLAVEVLRGEHGDGPATRRKHRLHGTLERAEPGMTLAADRRTGQLQMPRTAEDQLGPGNGGLGLLAETG